MAAPIAQHETFVEKRNYMQLKWNSSYPQYYVRDRKRGTSQYVSNKISLKPKTPATNWKFYKYQNHKIPHIRSLRGHSLSDIGESIITIGDRRKTPIIDIFKLNKQMTKMEKLNAANRSPCCRFHHSAEYIPAINQIFFFGGFDSQCNYNDARLFSLDTHIWSDLIYNADIEYRAFHSTATRIITHKHSKQWECYVFGGMCCAGGPYQYHNDMFKFTFCDGNYTDEAVDDATSEPQLGYFQCDPVQYNSTRTPRERSQSYSFIKDNTLYVYGGSHATGTLNDLWTLDLNTMIWTEIEYKGVLKAPMKRRLIPKSFRVVSFRKTCYFDKDLDQLIVIHFGTLSEIQTEFIKCGDTLNEFERRIIDKKKDMKGTKKGVIGLLHGGMNCVIFVFDLREQKWFIKRSRNVTDREKTQVPTNDIATTRIMRIGEYIAFIGGGKRQSKMNYMKHIHFLKIPNDRVIRTLSWSRERLLWIGHYKENNESVSIFNKCAKDVIHLIISFLNPRPPCAAS
eukprot:982088_1